MSVGFENPELEVERTGILVGYFASIAYYWRVARFGTDRIRGFEQEPKSGLRIDLILASAPAMENLVSTGIDFDARAFEKPSDHCPIWTDFKL